MVQIVTVSANTAAYAAEALKPSARVSGVPQPEKAGRAQAAERKRGDDVEQRAIVAVAQAPALSLFFLTAERQPDNTLLQAQKEYLQHLADQRTEGAEPLPEDGAENSVSE